MKQRNLWMGLLVLLVFLAVNLLMAGCDIAYEGVHEDVFIWTDELEGEHAYVLYDEQAGELLFVVDAEMLTLEELRGEPTLRTLAEGGSMQSVRTIGIPYLIQEQGAEQRRVMAD